MAIVLRRQAPEQGPNAIRKALSDLRGRQDSRELAASVLGGAAINLYQPLPVYRLGLDQIDGPDCVDRAEHVGWRYLIDSPGRNVGFADIRESGGESPRFSSFSQNQHAERLKQAAEVAQSVAQSLPDDYEARILEVPALYVSAVWLADQTHIYIPYIDMKRLHGEEVRVEENFIADLIAAAQAARKQLPVPG